MGRLERLAFRRIGFANMHNVLVTGGCGFIGSAFVRLLLRQTSCRITVLDSLTYAGRQDNLPEWDEEDRLKLVVGDVRDASLVEDLALSNSVDTVVHFAAQTHVDQSLHTPLLFSETNVHGTHVLLELARRHDLRFHHVGTDEVYGVSPAPLNSSESAPLHPNNPYSASKAGADLLVLAYHTTYGTRVTLSRGANSVGPRQHPEKVVPLFALCAIMNRPLPIYGHGSHERDYLWVDDHCLAILTILKKGNFGSVYNVGTGQTLSTLDVGNTVLEAVPETTSKLRHVEDRPGHDMRYSLDTQRLRELGWKPTFEPREAITQAVRWYRQHPQWWQPILTSASGTFFMEQYTRKIGTPL